jgi:acetolactate synthase-1/2/3 large subunit
MRLISTRHESGAAFMAEADAKLTGRPAVALATRGPGAANLSIGVQTAFEDSTPMLVLLGDVETDFAHRGAFQEVDLAAFYRPITKLSMAATRADRLPALVGHALRVATSGRPGPVMISLPADLLDVEIDSAPAADRPTAVPLSAPGPDDLDAIVRLLSTARQPVVIAGGGARSARGELIDFVEHYGLGVYAAFRRQDVFPNDHPNYLGHLTLGTPPKILECLHAADLVIVIGSRLSEVTTQAFTVPPASADVVQIDAEPGSIGVSTPVTLGVVADCRAALLALVKAGDGPRSQRSWQHGHDAFVGTAEIGPSRSPAGIDPAHVIDAMIQAFPSDAVITNDAGNFSTFLHRHWLYRHATSQAAPTSGAMGYGIPAAVGAKLALPDRMVVGVVGDGGLLMTGHEIETAVRERCPVTIVVLRNGLYGTIAMHQARHGFQLSAVTIGPVDVAGYARSLGAQARTVDNPDELREAFVWAAASGDKVTVIDVETDTDLISPTARLSDLMNQADR